MTLKLSINYSPINNDAVSRTVYSDRQHKILSLIAATIFADKHIYAAEIQMFIKVALDLNALEQMKPALSEAKILAWYELNKDDIRQKITTPYFKDWYYDILNTLSEVKDKQAILTAMEKIALADGSVHVSERALTMLAKRHWKIA